MTGERQHREVRVGTVVSGFLSLGIALIFFLSATQALNDYDLSTVVTWSVLLLGLLALVGAVLAGIVAAVRRSR